MGKIRYFQKRFAVDKLERQSPTYRSVVSAPANFAIFDLT